MRLEERKNRFTIAIAPACLFFTIESQLKSIIKCIRAYMYIDYRDNDILNEIFDYESIMDWPWRLKVGSKGQR